MNESRMSRRKPSKKRGGCFGLFVIFIFILLGAGLALGYAYYQVTQTAGNIQQERPAEQEVIREEPAELIQEEKPFSVLLLGIDSGVDTGSDSGRSDIMIFATVNPDSGNATMMSIPRDTLTEIAGLNQEDKINHAYAIGGVSMAANTVQSLLDVPVDYTVSVNMQGFEDIIDSLGGVQITALETFSQDNYNFTAGEEVTLSGEMALAYIRNREVVGGDHNRQQRARQLINALISQAGSFSSLTNLPALIQTLEGNVQTDLTFQEIRHLVMNYGNSINEVDTIQLQTSTQMIDDIYYEIIDVSHLNEIQTLLKQALELD